MQGLMTSQGAPLDEGKLRLGVEIARRVGKLPIFLTAIEHDRDRPPGDTVLAQACGILEIKGLKAWIRCRPASRA